MVLTNLDGPTHIHRNDFLAAMSLSPLKVGLTQKRNNQFHFSSAESTFPFTLLNSGVHIDLIIFADIFPLNLGDKEIV